MVDRIADAVLYEGYILYPYRPSVKNHQRWTFGGLFPEAYCRAARSGDVSGNQTQCAVRGSDRTCVEIRVRFLHLIERKVGAVEPARSSWNDEEPPAFRDVASLKVGESTYQAWQEAEERQVVLPAMSMESLMGSPVHHKFAFPGRRRLEPLQDQSKVVGVLIREQATVTGSVEASAAEFGKGLFRLSVRVSCHSPGVREAGTMSRQEANLYSLVSSHNILTLSCDGAFGSLADPPDWAQEVTESCRNVGLWPVLVGKPGETNTILSAPIILPDYPEIAPESPGDYFDGTEMDEMLTLRILTMTDEEKRSMSGIDERARALLDRTESLGNGARRALHGVLRTGWSAEEASDV